MDNQITDLLSSTGDMNNNKNNLGDSSEFKPNFFKKESSPNLKAQIETTNNKDGNVNTNFFGESRRKRRAQSVITKGDPFSKTAPDFSFKISNEDDTVNVKEKKDEEINFNSNIKFGSKEEEAPKNNNNNIIQRTNDKYEPKINNDNYYPANSRLAENPIDSGFRNYMNNNNNNEEKDREISTLKFQIKEMEKRHEQELNDLKTRYNNKIQTLEKEKNDEIQNEKSKYQNLLHSKEIEIAEEKLRLEKTYESKAKLLEEEYRLKLEAQKKEIQIQNDSLQKQINQQLEFKNLINQVQSSSRQIEELLTKQKFDQNEQNRNNNTFQTSVNDLNFLLKQMDDRLKEDRDNLLRDKEAFMKEYNEKQKKLAQEEINLREERRNNQNFEKQIREENLAKQEEYEKQNLILKKQFEDSKNENENIKHNYAIKMNELESQRKIFEEEKKMFQNQMKESITQLETQKKDLEERKNKYLQEELEIRDKIKLLQEREFYLQDKLDNLDNKDKELKEKERILDKKDRDLCEAGRRINNSIKTFEEKEMKFNQDNEILLRKQNDIENEILEINREKLQLEQEKSEVKLRMQSIDLMRMKYVSEPLSNVPLINRNFPPAAPNTNQTNNGLDGGNNINSRFNDYKNSKYNTTSNFGFHSKYNNSQLRGTEMTQNQYVNNGNEDPSFSETTGRRYTPNKGFNADDYFKNLQLKMSLKNPGNTGNSSQYMTERLRQEEEYIKKSMEYANTKDEYERKRKQLLFSTGKESDGYKNYNIIDNNKSCSSKSFKNNVKASLKSSSKRSYKESSKLNDDDNDELCETDKRRSDDEFGDSQNEE